MPIELLRERQLLENGLNLIAIFNLNDLDKGVLERLRTYSSNIEGFKQLLLIGHAGKKMWQCLQSVDVSSDNPVDDYSIRTIEKFLKYHYPHLSYQIIYPIHQGVALQRLGELAGWHYSSPFMVGVNNRWGSWFAYRALVLLDSNFQLTTKQELGNPCLTCQHKPCISICPGRALDSGSFELDKCSTYRKKDNSLCRYNCLSRYHCPIAVEHRYSDEQIHYHYSVSLKMIGRYGS